MLGRKGNATLKKKRRAPRYLEMAICLGKFRYGYTLGGEEKAGVWRPASRRCVEKLPDGQAVRPGRPEILFIQRAVYGGGSTGPIGNIEGPYCHSQSMGFAYVRHAPLLSWVLSTPFRYKRGPGMRALCQICCILQSAGKTNTTRITPR